MRLCLIIISTLVLFTRCNFSFNNQDERVTILEFQQKRVPLFTDRDNNALISVGLDVSEGDKPVALKRIEIIMDNNSTMGNIYTFSATHSTSDTTISSVIPGRADIKKNVSIFNTSAEFTTGENTIHFDFNPVQNADLGARFQIEKIKLHFKNSKPVEYIPENNFTYRIARIVRKAGQDNCDTYRIPGIITTGKGTLIAVYDNRYNNSKDLQEDIDVGMSRSTDGGNTWEPMKVIMDMGEWGGRPERLNGIGDPAVLYDHTTRTIWVAALWISGFNEKDMLWWASQPGLMPDETGQLMLIKSTDDGLTWSEPINITKQIKEPKWQLLFHGPGRGITLDDGTLVFAAQYKENIGQKALDGGQYTSHATIIYSKDGGEIWHIGTGAKPNTTEAQVIQLTDGSLMLNMRDDHNRRVKDDTNGRAVAISSDFGKSWTTHPSSNSALQEPNCMASLIDAELSIRGQKQQVLFFSNPNNKHSRTNMTIKASLDGGHTWPEQFQVELNEAPGYGYSCMTMIDENTVGILYEGVKDLYFQAIPVVDIIGLP